MLSSLSFLKGEGKTDESEVNGKDHSPNLICS